MDISKRDLLKAAVGMSCFGFYPLSAKLSHASRNSDRRMVVVLLRGAMDALDVCRPFTDRLLSKYRPDFDYATPDNDLLLDADHSLNPSLRKLGDCWRDGDLAFVRSVSTPYRDTRSHFEGQDILEFGSLSDVETGWLSRAVNSMSGVSPIKSVYYGGGNPLLLRGLDDVLLFSDGIGLELSEEEQIILDSLYSSSSEFSHIEIDDLVQHYGLIEENDMQSTQMSVESTMKKSRVSRSFDGARVGSFIAKKLMEEYRIATYSIGGWDTHVGQSGRIAKPLQRLADSIDSLKEGLGDEWSNTVVVCVTEFGRTVRQNGSKGTDHGTGSLMMFAGGAVKGGELYGDWPSLQEKNLYQNRDIMPTDDLRRYLGWTLVTQFGVSRSNVESIIFPGVSLQANPGLFG